MIERINEQAGQLAATRRTTTTVEADIAMTQGETARTAREPESLEYKYVSSLLVVSFFKEYLYLIQHTGAPESTSLSWIERTRCGS